MMRNVLSCLLVMIVLMPLDLRAECPDPQVRTLNVKQAPLTELEVLLGGPLASSRNADDPPEISSLDFGLYKRWIGAFINDGLAWWHGVNFQTGEIFRITRFSGRKLANAPTAQELPPNALIRRTEMPSPRVEVARSRKLSTDELGMIICLVNDFYETPDQDNSTRQDAVSRGNGGPASDTAGEYITIRAPKMNLSLLPKNRLAEERRKRLFDYIEKLPL